MKKIFYVVFNYFGPEADEAVHCLWVHVPRNRVLSSLSIDSCSFGNSPTSLFVSFTHLYLK